MTNENCWVLIGGETDYLWWGKRLRKTAGTPVSVQFDPDFVLAREDSYQDVIGFCHTHPTFLAVPSDRDMRTMAAWTDCLGKSLICVIKGIDGLRAFWFDVDCPDYVECEVLRFGKILVGSQQGVKNEQAGNVGGDGRHTGGWSLDDGGNNAVVSVSAN